MSHLICFHAAHLFCSQVITVLPVQYSTVLPVILGRFPQNSFLTFLHVAFFSSFHTGQRERKAALKQNNCFLRSQVQHYSCTVIS